MNNNNLITIIIKILESINKIINKENEAFIILINDTDKDKTLVISLKELSEDTLKLIKLKYSKITIINNEGPSFLITIIYFILFTKINHKINFVINKSNYLVTLASGHISEYPSNCGTVIMDDIFLGQTEYLKMGLGTLMFKFLMMLTIYHKYTNISMITLTEQKGFGKKCGFKKVYGFLNNKTNNVCYVNNMLINKSLYDLNNKDIEQCLINDLSDNNTNFIDTALYKNYIE